MFNGFALNLYFALLSHFPQGVKLLEFLKSLFKTFLAINIFLHHLNDLSKIVKVVLFFDYYKISFIYKNIFINKIIIKMTNLKKILNIKYLLIFFLINILFYSLFNTFNIIENNRNKAPNVKKASDKQNKGSTKRMNVITRLS